MHEALSVWILSEEGTRNGRRNPQIRARGGGFLISGLAAEILCMSVFLATSKEGDNATHATKGVVIPEVLHPVNTGQLGFCEWGESSL